MQHLERCVRTRTIKSVDPVGEGARRAVLFVIVPVVLLSSAIGFAAAQQSGWTQMTPTRAPSARAGHDMAYDSESDRVILFGGEIAPGSNVLNDETWAYNLNNNTWENRNPSSGPGSRFAHAMAYDVDSDRVILFGGWTGAEQRNETWAYDYDTNTWTNMSPATSPPVAVFVTAAYDAESDRIILFGGRNAVQDFNDTWAYNYNNDTWTRMSPPSKPSPRHGLAMAYDASSDRVILFGGTTVTGNLVGGDETWVYTFNENTWIQAEKGSGPSSRYGAVMAYDTKASRVVLFGGSFEGNQTWSYRSVSAPPTLPWVYIAAGAVIGAVAAVVAAFLIRRRKGKQRDQP